MKANDELDDSIRKIGVQLEQVLGQNQAVLEAVSDMQQQVKHIPAMRADLYELKTDVSLIKAALRETNQELRYHDRRITKLEAKVFHA